MRNKIVAWCLWIVGLLLIAKAWAIWQDEEYLHGYDVGYDNGRRYELFLHRQPERE